MLTLRHLHRSTRGASLTEYAVLSGLLGAVAIGSVLTLGGEVAQGSEAGTAALTDAFYTAEAPLAPVSPPLAVSPLAGGVEGVSGGAGAEPPTPVVPVYPAACYVGLELVYKWSWHGAYTPPTSASSPLAWFSAPDSLHPYDDCHFLPAFSSYESFGNMNAIAGTGPRNAWAPAPFSAPSSHRLLSGGGFDVAFGEPVVGLEFYIHDLDGLAPTAPRVVGGRVVSAGSPGFRDVVSIEGVAPDGTIVFPAASLTGSAVGGGSFLGLANRDCGVWDTDCKARFVFADTVVGLRVSLDSGGVIDVSDLKGFVAQP